MKSLQKYIDDKNIYQEMFKKPLINNADQLTDREIDSLLDQVFIDLEPENLTCDGEASRAYIQQRASFLYDVEEDLLYLQNNLTKEEA
jgi:hypothetical protein